MLGAVIGDVVGSQFEGSNRKGGVPMKEYDFPLFTDRCRPTDDTVCTLAIAESLLYGTHLLPFQVSLLNWCRRYPKVGYGPAFAKWFISPDPQPYDSYGNGSAMRVSPVGFYVSRGMELRDSVTGVLMGGSLPKVETLARRTAEPSHGHAEGIKGARAVACAVYIAHRAPYPDDAVKRDIKDYIEKEFGYDLSTPLEKIRPTYAFDVTCQGSVPQAIRCFLESKDFVDCIRLAVSLGGDSDTQGAIAGGIAQAFYKKIPEQMVVETFARLPHAFVDLILRFHDKFDVSF